MEREFDAEISRLERRSRTSFVIFLTGWALACGAILLAMFRQTNF